MRTFLIISLLISVVFLASSCTNKSKNVQHQKENVEIVYTCPMHPEVQSNKQGTCPKCGMELVKADTLRSDTTYMEHKDHN